MRIAYRTSRGVFFQGLAEDVLTASKTKKYVGKVDLIFTSPPFPLNRKKKYGNFQGEEYINWLKSLAPLFRKFLKPKGSIVMEVGNSWEPGKPVMSTLALKALLAFLEAGKFHLCQQFIWNNPARLPSPAQWVNVERIRLKDSYTHLWWMSPTERPKANNRRVLAAYSDSMNKLLESKKYNAGKRPSEHHIGKKSFLKNNRGAIPSNVITLSNTQASSDYLIYCRKHNLVTIRLFVVSDMSPNDPYVTIDARKSTEVIIIINQTHPHWSQLKGSEGVLNYLRHCTYDGIAEWQAWAKASRMDSDTIKLLKDKLLRVPFEIEKHGSD